MKKITVKRRRYIDPFAPIRGEMMVESTGELIVVSGFEFCLVRDEEYRKIHAIELSTGYAAASIPLSTRGFKKLLIERLNSIPEDKMRKEIEKTLKKYKNIPLNPLNQ